MQDPYRFILPCGHHSFYETGKDPRGNKSETTNESGYYCKQCRETYQKKFDKKEERTIYA